MREILFRGKRINNGEWAYGYYAHLPSAAGAADIIYVPASDPDDSNHTVFVDPKTIGQYTGLTDKNGVKIFEGDIIKTRYTKEVFAVIFDELYSAFAVRDARWVRYGIPKLYGDPMEVIGNIHDNPELIEDMDVKPAAKRGDAPAEQLGLAPAT